MQYISDYDIAIAHNRWERGRPAPGVRWKVWRWIRSQFHLTKHSNRIWSNETAIKSMALLDHNDWGRGRPLEEFILLIY